MGLEVLRAVVKQAGDGREIVAGLPPAELRFVIEFKDAPDLTAQRARIATLLGSENFALESLFQAQESPLDRFVVLRIVGVQRVFPQDILFEMAYGLASELDAVSVEPDVGARIFEEADPSIGGPQTEAALVRGWCNVDDPAPANKLWAPELIRANLAWAQDPNQGAGVIVAQPDTGIVPGHSELEDGVFDMARGANILEPGKPPHDPLSSGMANPGHGTATASCVASRHAGVITGAAPGAQVAPIRCINDVKVFDAAPVARAIDHARQQQCHVITMSLGGLPSRALHAALKAAVNAHLIVLAAAGNCVRFVVWPARYNECIAVAGVNVNDKPWKGSSRGDNVDISAPAENVWKANAANAAQPVTPGQGTSFAVALTAGVAALWIGHHGHAASVNEANRRGVKVQDLFRAALAQTARVPAVWDADDFGAGVVDANNLLSLALADIRVAQREAVVEAPPANEIAALLVETGSDLPAPQPQFDWARFGLEVASVAAENARRNARADGGAVTEMGMQGYRPSRSLLAALGDDTAERAEDFAPTPRIVPAEIPAENRRLLQILGPRSTVNLQESAPAGMSDVAAARALSHSADKLMGNAFTRLDELRTPGNAAEHARLKEILGAHGKRALEGLAAGRDVSGMAPGGGASLEALVVLTGERPALRVNGDTIDFNDPQLRDWQGPLLLIRDLIPKLTRSVGRIDLVGRHVGTGFLIAPNLVMTNRHVLEILALPVPTDVNPASWVLGDPEITIDFKVEQGSVDTLKFQVEEVVFAGPTPTNDTPFVDFNDLDVAILRIAAQSLEGKNQPPPLNFLKGDLGTHGSSDLLVIGYPARPKFIPKDENGKVRQDVLDLLMSMFNLMYSVKYLSPGRVMKLPGQVASDPRQWVFNHDAATLQGNSGSCVIRYGPKPAVIGLHFAGELEKANSAHAMLRLVNGQHLPKAVTDQFNWVQE